MEKASNDSKQSFSLMWCGSAAGEMMPPMVVYGKIKNLYENWIDGPPGSIFHSTNSGWFDSGPF